MLKKNQKKNIIKTKKKTKIIWSGFILRLFLFFLIGIFGYVGFVVNKINRVQKEIITSNPNEKQENGVIKILSAAKSLVRREFAPLKGMEAKRINLLLMGLGGEGHKGENLTDTLILVSINPETYETAMISLPRDLYVQIPETNYHTKINALYTYALNQKDKQPVKRVQKSIEQITGQEIQYYAIIDFEGFKKIIQNLEGIEVEVDQDIYDPRFPGPNYSYEIFEIKKGFHNMDADTALKYARVRHTTGGDFARAKRQQQVLAATKRRAFSLGTLTNPYKVTNLLENLGDHLKTNIQIEEIPSFINLANNINIHQTTNKVIDAWQKDSLLAVTHVPLGGVNAFALVPRVGSYQEIHDVFKNIFNLSEIEKRKELINKEQAKILIVPQEKGAYQKARRVIKEFNYQADFDFKEKFSCPPENIIYDISENKKMFSLDDLSKKFNAKVALNQAKISEIKNIFYPEESQPPINSLQDLLSQQNSQESEFSTSETEQEKYDFIVCLSKESLDFMEKQEKIEQELFEKQQIINEDGSVMINKEN